MSSVVPKRSLASVRRSVAVTVTNERKTPRTSVQSSSKSGSRKENTPDFIFRARPLDRRVLESCGDMGVPKIAKLPLTRPISPKLSTKGRSAARKSFDESNKSSNGPVRVNGTKRHVMRVRTSNTENNENRSSVVVQNRNVTQKRVPSSKSARVPQRAHNSALKTK